jgi:pimeloyl-ACP methyl ester carboxylesterase
MRNLVKQTAGGKQLWADEWFFRTWRIQRNVLTGHCRLLDDRDRRHASGTFDTCRKELDAIRRRESLQPMEGRAVVVLHGLFRTRAAMRQLTATVARCENCSPFCMGYPTTRGSVADHAKSLDRVIRSLEGIHEINFVAHSLGNLVVRRWLHDLQEQGRALPDGQEFGRMVMLAPPNHQPQLATKLLGSYAVGLIAGTAAGELATGWDVLQPKLATPAFEFGILAGGRGDGRGYNPLIPGDDDAVVTVESTRLAGARDFRLLPVIHSFFMYDRKVQELTRNFLEFGYFASDQTRQKL